MEKILSDSKACEKVCADARDASLERLKPYERDQSFEVRQKFQKVRDDYEACYLPCATRFRLALEPVQNELIANTNKIQAAGISEQPAGSRDPDLKGQHAFSQPVEDVENTRPEENKTKSKEVECQRLIEFRNGGMKRLYLTTLTQFEINQEAWSDFSRYRKEIENEGKYFSTEAEAAYFVAQVAKTTSNLVRNAFEIYFGSGLKPLNSSIDKFLGSLTEEEDKLGAYHEAVYEKACSLLSNTSGRLGSSAKAACTFINDVKHLSTIKSGLKDSRTLLKSQMLVISAHLATYEQNLLTEKNNLSNLNKIQETLNDYLSKNCSK